MLVYKYFVLFFLPFYKFLSFSLYSHAIQAPVYRHVRNLPEASKAATQKNIVTASLLASHPMKYTYFDIPCLGGFYGIALIHQFQSHKTVSFRSSLLVLIPVLLCRL